VRKLNLVILAIIIFVAGILCLATSDSKASIADTNVANNDVTTSINQTDNPSSATATITITMRTPPLPDE
jgi:hypothetical protein